MTGKKKGRERMGFKRGNSFKNLFINIYTTTVKKRTTFVICLCLFQAPIMGAIRNKENPRGF